MGDLHSWIAIGIAVACAPFFARAYLRHLRKDVHLWLVSAFLTGFCTMFGGTYGSLMNLYLVKLGYGPDVIGMLNTAFYVGMALLAAVSGPLIRLLGGVRNSAALGMVMVVIGQMAFPLPTILGTQPSVAWLASTLMIASAGITLYAVNIWPFMASRIEPEKRAFGFAGHLGLVPVGGMLGTVLSGAFASALAGNPDVPARELAITLGISGALMIIAVVVLLLIPKQPLLVQEAATSASPQPSIARAAAPVLVIAMMVVVMIFDVSGEGVARVFQNVYMATSLSLPTERVTQLLGYGQLLAAIGVFMTPAFIARLGLSYTFILTTLGMSLGLAVVSTIPNQFAAAAGYALLIGFSQMARAAKTQYAMEVVEEYYRPHISGFMQFAETGTVSLLALIGGNLLQTQRVTFPGLFNAVAVSTALAALWFYLFFVRHPRGALRTAT